MIETAYEDLLNVPYMDFVRDDAKLNQIKALPYSDTVKVTSEYRNRLDLVSYDFYGTVSLWWVVAMYNNIIDPMDFTEQDLQIPSHSSIESMLVDELISRNNV